jgi:ribosomal protein S17E
MTDEKCFDSENYLLWWCLSGGLPKYLEWIIGAKGDVVNRLINDSSPLIKEGHHRLVEDFGDEHRTYFDILGAIASGYNTKPKIVNYLGYQINEAFPKLTDSFEIINKISSMDASVNSKTIRYEIADPFNGKIKRSSERVISVRTEKLKALFRDNRQTQGTHYLDGASIRR